MNKTIFITLGVIIIAGAAFFIFKKPAQAPVPAGPNPATVSTVLPTPYISEQTPWPPTVQLSATAYSCATGSEKQINGKTYCVTLVAEGAAGHAYKTYTYVTADGLGTKTLTFTLNYQNCGVYDGAQMATCQAAQAGFDVDLVADSLM